MNTFRLVIPPSKVLQFGYVDGKSTQVSCLLCLLKWKSSQAQGPEGEDERMWSLKIVQHLSIMTSFVESQTKCTAKLEPLQQYLGQIEKTAWVFLSSALVCFNATGSVQVEKRKYISCFSYRVELRGSWLKEP